MDRSPLLDDQNGGAVGDGASRAVGPTGSGGGATGAGHGHVESKNGATDRGETEAEGNGSRGTVSTRVRTQQQQQQQQQQRRQQQRQQEQQQQQQQQQQRQQDEETRAASKLFLPSLKDSLTLLRRGFRPGEDDDDDDVERGSELVPESDAMSRQTMQDSWFTDEAGDELFRAVLGPAFFIYPWLGKDRSRYVATLWGIVLLEVFGFLFYGLLGASSDKINSKLHGAFMAVSVLSGIATYLNPIIACVFARAVLRNKHVRILLAHLLNPQEAVKRDAARVLHLAVSLDPARGSVIGPSDTTASGRHAPRSSQGAALARERGDEYAAHIRRRFATALISGSAVLVCLLGVMLALVSSMFYDGRNRIIYLCTVGIMSISVIPFTALYLAVFGLLCQTMVLHQCMLVSRILHLAGVGSVTTATDTIEQIAEHHVALRASFLVIEKRFAWLPAYSLVANLIGLLAVVWSLYTFHAGVGTMISYMVVLVIMVLYVSFNVAAINQIGLKEPDIVASHVLFRPPGSLSGVGSRGSHRGEVFSAMKHSDGTQQGPEAEPTMPTVDTLAAWRDHERARDLVTLTKESPLFLRVLDVRLTYASAMAVVFAICTAGLDALSRIVV